MPASIFNGNAVKILKNVLRFKDGTELASTIANYVSTLTSDAQTQLDAKIDASEKGAALGVATLDAGGKVPVGQLPSSIMEYKGTWDASTNTPALADGVGDTGDVYRVSVAGTQDLGNGPISFSVGDYVIYNGVEWEKSDTTDAVASVNGYTGIVVLVSDDIAEGATNLYFTDARAQAAITGGASSIVTADLTASRALASDGAGKVSASSVTATELGQLSGVSFNIQTQLNGKANTALSNLSATAINTDLLPNTDNTRTLGFYGAAWIEGWINQLVAPDTNRSIHVANRELHDTTNQPAFRWANLGFLDALQELRMNGEKISGAADATADQDVVNRRFSFRQLLKNYLQVFFDGSQTTSINLYKDAVSSQPTDGTGGSPTGIAILLNITDQLRNSSNQQLSKSPVTDAQGEGWSIDITADRAEYEQNADLFVKFKYRTTVDYQSGDVRVFAYDITNGRVLNVLSLNGDGSILKADSGSQFVGRFSTNSTSSSYRVIFHVASANLNAYDIDIIDLSVGPDSVVPGAIAKETQNYSPVITGFGTVTLDGMTYSQFGDQLLISGRFNAGTVAASAATIALPAGYVTKALTSQKVVGKWWRNNTSASTDKEGTIIATSGGLTVLMGNGSYTSATTPLTGANGNTLALSGESISVWFVVPVTAAASALVSTNELLLKNLKTYMQRDAALSIANNTATTVVFDTEVNDEFSAYNTSTGVFTAPRSDWYLSIGQVKYQGYASGAIAQVFLRKNGVTDILQYDIATPTTAAAWTLPVNKLVYLNEGETLQVVTFQNSGSSRALSVGESQTFWSIVQQPDLATFGTYGQFQIIPATSSTKTPSASGDFHALSGNSINLPVGTWKLKSQGSFLNSGASPSYTILRMGWYAANGADSSAQPALLSSIPGLTILSAYAPAVDQFYEETSAIANRIDDGYDLIVQCTQPCTVYLVTNTSQSTSANARVTVYGTAERLQ